MSKSLGEEFFAGYKRKFVAGALDKATEEEANYVWENMETFGSMGFNKSHAVSYGLLSYWCAYLKTHFPLQFARASLNHAKDNDQALTLLREFELDYIAVDPEHSTTEWTVHNGKLVGPLTAIHGVGPKIAQDIIERRAEGRALTPRQEKLLASGDTPYDVLFPADKLWGGYYRGEDPLGILKRPVRFDYLKDVQGDGDYTFIGLLVDRNLRDLNEYGNVVKRGGREVKGPSLFLNLTVKDDTDSIICTIDRFQFEKIGREIAETGKVGEDWFMIHGNMKNGWRKIYVKGIRKLNAESTTQTEADQDAVQAAAEG